MRKVYFRNTALARIPVAGPDWDVCEAVPTDVGAILDEAAKLGWPIHYGTDLEHDRRWLEARADSGRQFVWMIRESGTWIIGDQCGRAGWTHNAACVNAWRRSEPGARVYLWDGHKLKLRDAKSDPELVRMIDKWERESYRAVDPWTGAAR